MTDDALVGMILSGDPLEALDGLFALGGKRDKVPPGEVFDAAMARFGDADPELRRQAVISVGIHWARVGAFDAICEIANNDADGDVRQAAVSAVARIAREAVAKKQRAVGVLGRLALSPKVPRNLRALANVELRWLLGTTSPRQHALELLNPEQVEIEDSFVEAALSKA